MTTMVAGHHDTPGSPTEYALSANRGLGRHREIMSRITGAHLTTCLQHARVFDFCPSALCDLDRPFRSFMLTHRVCKASAVVLSDRGLQNRQSELAGICQLEQNHRTERNDTLTTNEHHASTFDNGENTKESMELSGADHQIGSHRCILLVTLLRAHWSEGVLRNRKSRGYGVFFLALLFLLLIVYRPPLVCLYRRTATHYLLNFHSFTFVLGSRNNRLSGDTQYLPTHTSLHMTRSSGETQTSMPARLLALPQAGHT